MWLNRRDEENYPPYKVGFEIAWPRAFIRIVCGYLKCDRVESQDVITLYYFDVLCAGVV